MPTLLSALREQSQVDCDTLDESVASALGPFVDCTSNQAIAFFELQKPHHADLLKRSGALALQLGSQYADVDVVALAVEVAVRKTYPLILTVPKQSCTSHY